MHIKICVLRGFFVIFLISWAHSVYAEQHTPIEVAKQNYADSTLVTSPLTSGVFGDQVSLYDGSLRFTSIDIAIAGNSKLPVELRRVLNIENKKSEVFEPGLTLFKDWIIDIPYIYGEFYNHLRDDSGNKRPFWSVREKINNVYQQTTTANRCSTISTPPVPPIAQFYFLSSFWNGYYMNIPGDHREILLANDSSSSVSSQYKSTYPWTTKSGWVIGCLASTKNGYEGQAFFAISPDGTKYYFDVVFEPAINMAMVPRVAQMPTPGEEPPGGEYEDSYQPEAYPRVRTYMLVSRIEDPHGNWVTYDYGTPVFSKLNVNSSDGRFINVHIGPFYTVDYIESSIGKWTYSYAKSNNSGGLTVDILSQVTQPDGSAWKYSANGDLYTMFAEETGQDDVADCPEPTANGTPYTYIMQSPSGATATFAMEFRGNSRVRVPRWCTKISKNLEYLDVPMKLWNYVLTQKTLSGPGMATSTWTYAYQAPPYGLFDDTCTSDPAACDVYRTATITRPDASVERYTYGVNYGVDEGNLIKKEVMVNGQTKATEGYSYLPQAATTQANFPTRAGTDISSFPDRYRTEQAHPLITSESLVDGVFFRNEVAKTCGSSGTDYCFDRFARPTTTIKSSQVVP